ncbi:MAG TPA: hypothetical protein VFT65_03100 [Candidatus Angelobacter sp.]|nr:hypothetical protein [Candidatus Angelobacter sp.]
MRPTISFALAALLAAGSYTTLAQTEITDPGAKQVCASVKDAEPPAADRPASEQEKALANCSSLDAYFGFDQPADPVKARHCAFAQVDRNDKTALGGRAILMMIYANGKGVPRNFDLALKFACTIGDAPGDAAGRVYQLDRLRKANWAGSNFSVCDHSSGREMYEQCAILEDRFDKPERERKLEALSEAWSPRQKKAFHTFLEEAERYFKVEAGNGVNLQASFAVQEETFLRNNMIASLQQFEGGELPKSSAEDFHQAEAAENAAYHRTQTGDVARWGTLTRESVRRSEEEWHHYVAAWIAFGRQKYPSVTEQAWKAWLDQERLVMFNRFLR